MYIYTLTYIVVVYRCDSVYISIPMLIVCMVLGAADIVELGRGGVYMYTPHIYIEIYIYIIFYIDIISIYSIYICTQNDIYIDIYIYIYVVELGRGGVYIYAPPQNDIYIDIYIYMYIDIILCTYVY